MRTPCLRASGAVRAARARRARRGLRAGTDPRAAYPGHRTGSRPAVAPDGGGVDAARVAGGGLSEAFGGLLRVLRGGASIATGVCVGPKKVPHGSDGIGARFVTHMCVGREVPALCGEVPGLSTDPCTGTWRVAATHGCV